MVKNIFRGQFFLISLFLFILTIPFSVTAETNPESQDLGTIELFRTTGNLTIGGFSIKDSTYFYGYENENGVSIQYGNTNKLIPKEALVKVESNENVSGLFEFETADTQVLAKGTTLYKEAGEGSPSGTILNETDYPVYEESNGHPVIYLGNVAFHLSDIESSAVEGTADAELSETVEGEENTSITKETEASSDKAASGEREDDTSVVDNGTTEAEPSKDAEKQDGASSEEEAVDPVQEEEQSGTALTQEEEKKVDTKSLNKVTVQSVNPWDGSEAGYFKVTDTTTVYDNRGNGALRPMGQLEEGQV
ncbi:hypothetical protein, partial [Sediminibacillus terrae]|uniref:hypothetical protein n=1 Tax=Sediminibacillus terrae TaxID=1562106 RepID=UPI00192A2C0B